MNVTEHRPIYRRIDLAAKAPTPVIAEAEECPYARAKRINRIRDTWDALTATAKASQQGDTGRGEG